jgi:hypothetical protein
VIGVIMAYNKNYLPPEKAEELDGCAETGIRGTETDPAGRSRGNGFCANV